MPDQNFKNRLKSLKLSKKIIYFSSALTILSVFMPWYSDIDKFKIGDSFLGITGPLYLAGFIVLTASVLSFGIITMTLKGRTLPKLPLKEEHFYIFNSGLSLLMLTLCASVYFHTKFGINITDKNAGFGLTLAFCSCISSLLGGLLVSKEQSTVSFETEGELKPLINLNQERKTQDLTMNREQTVGQAIQDNEKTEKQETVMQNINQGHNIVTQSEDKKLWGWGHNINNQNK